MTRVQHSKPSRRLAWAAAALVLLALPTAAPASAQGFFFLFGGPSPYEIERQLAAAGYLVTSPLTLRGDVYLVDVVVRGEGPERLVLDAHSGRIVERYRGRADRWREAAAPPPSAWGDDPSQWNGPRPPAAIGPAAAPPPDAFAPPKPDVLEAPKAGQAERRRRDQAQADSQADAGRQCEQSSARRRRSAAGRQAAGRAAGGCLVFARRRSGFAEPGAERRCGAGESRSGRRAAVAGDRGGQGGRAERRQAAAALGRCARQVEGGQRHPGHAVGLRQRKRAPRRAPSLRLDGLSRLLGLRRGDRRLDRLGRGLDRDRARLLRLGNFAHQSRCAAARSRKPPAWRSRGRRGGSVARRRARRCPDRATRAFRPSPARSWRRAPSGRLRASRPPARTRRSRRPPA